MFQKILKIAIENVGEQDSLEDIWDFWQTITTVKKAYINWVTKQGLYKHLYSKNSILDFIGRFTDENLLKFMSTQL